MKKKIFRILIVIAIIIVFFFASFKIGLQIVSKDKRTKVEATQDIKENESIQNNSIRVGQTNSEEKIYTGCDIEATKKNSFSGTIVEVDMVKKEILVENPSHLVVSEIYKTCEWKNNHKVTINGKTYIKAGYALCLNNVPIKDYNGKQIDINNLKVGDNINVSTRNVEYNNKLIYETLTSDNIILIERKDSLSTTSSFFI